MKKKILLILGILSIFIPVNTYAASGSIKASVSSTKVTLNNTFNVTVKVNTDGALGAWQFNVDYDSSKLSLQSGDTRIVGYGDGTYSTKTYTYKFKAISLGSAKVNVVNAEIATWEPAEKVPTSAAGVTVTISEPVSIVYSSDNNLSSLSIDGYEISPAFDKQTLEYTATAKPGETEITINAKAAHKAAKVTGIGKIALVEGENALQVVVTAENGATKTYAIKVSVPEKEPIKLDSYSIFRKLPEERPLYFNEKTIKINEEDVSTLYNEKLDLTLVNAQSSDGKTGYYIYQGDKITGKFYYLNSGTLAIYIDDKTGDISLDGLSKKTLKVGELEIKNAYQITKDSKYFVVKGKDLVTGKTNFYNYDSTNQTLQIFDTESFDYLQDQLNDRMIIIYALGGSIVVLLLITILLARNKSKLKIIESKLEQKPDKKNKSNE